MVALTKVTGQGIDNVTVDSNGKVGIGDTSPDALLSIKGDSDAATTPTIRLKDGTDAREAWITNESGDLSLNSGGSDNAYHSKIVIADGNLIIFHTSGAEKARFDASGNLLIGVSSFTSGGGGVQLGSTQATREFSASGTGAIQQIGFHNPNGEVGSIYSSSSSTVFATSSDYRLKENIDYTWDATTRLKQLKPARFNFIADDTNTLVDGFIAHEAATVVPEAIIGTKDAVNEDGNIKPQGIDQSKLVPLLVKTIQELEARITALESA